MQSNQKPLYYFKLNTETGQFTKFKITSYEKYVNGYNSRISYRFKFESKNGSRSTKIVTDDQLDQLSHYRVISFNPDIDHAKDVMVRSMQADIAVCKAKLTKLESIISTVNCASEVTNNV